MQTAIGLMSGTSMDGIDVALVRTDGEKQIEFGPSMAVEYGPDIRKNIEQALVDAQGIEDRTERPGCLRRVESDITQLHADAVNQFLKSNSLESEMIQTIGFHGQTVLHRPEVALTVQLGDGAKLAAKTGIDVVYDMRAADMTMGGQGAPLVPVFHKALAQNLNFDGPVCFVNIGGISNITYVGGDTLIAFDTGPGNALIDQWVLREAGLAFDDGGAIGAKGMVVESVLREYLAQPYFERALPKSLDRNDFEPLQDDNIELADGARTLARVTAATIMKSTEHLPQNALPKTWIVCGGGRLNANIMRDLTELAARQGAKVILSEEAELEGDQLEAQAFAYLAVRSKKGLPLTFPATTGCQNPVSGGVLAKAP